MTSQGQASLQKVGNYAQSQSASEAAELLRWQAQVKLLQNLLVVEGKGREDEKEILKSERLAWERREKAWDRRREEFERALHLAEHTSSGGSATAVAATGGGG